MDLCDRSGVATELGPRALGWVIDLVALDTDSITYG
jgi:hypothetical protein